MKTQRFIDNEIASTLKDIEKKSLELKNKSMIPPRHNALYNLCLRLGADSNEDIVHEIIRNCKDYIENFKPILKVELEKLAKKLDDIVLNSERLSIDTLNSESFATNIPDKQFKFGANFKRRLFKTFDVEGKLEFIGSPILVYLTGIKMNMYGDFVKLGYIVFTARGYNKKLKMAKEYYFNEAHKLIIQSSLQILSDIKQSYYVEAQKSYHLIIEQIYSNYLTGVSPQNMLEVSHSLYHVLNQLNVEMECQGYMEGGLDKNLIYFIAGRIGSSSSSYSSIPQDVIAYWIWEYLVAKE